MSALRSRNRGSWARSGPAWIRSASPTRSSSQPGDRGAWAGSRHGPSRIAGQTRSAPAAWPPRRRKKSDAFAPAQRPGSCQRTVTPPGVQITDSAGKSCETEARHADCPMTGREGWRHGYQSNAGWQNDSLDRSTRSSTSWCDRLGAMSRFLCGVASVPADGRRAYTSPARMVALRAHGNPPSRTVRIRSLTGPRRQPSPSPERPTLNVAAVFARTRRNRWQPAPSAG